VLEGKDLNKELSEDLKEEVNGELILIVRGDFK